MASLGLSPMLTYFKIRDPIRLALNQFPWKPLATLFHDVDPYNVSKDQGRRVEKVRVLTAQKMERWKFNKKITEKWKCHYRGTCLALFIYFLLGSSRSTRACTNS